MILLDASAGSSGAEHVGLREDAALAASAGDTSALVRALRIRGLLERERAIAG
jgi:hypothetical protein